MVYKERNKYPKNINIGASYGSGIITKENR
jgi:hypothetical protein